MVLDCVCAMQTIMPGVPDGQLLVCLSVDEPKQDGLTRACDCCHMVMDIAVLVDTGVQHGYATNTNKKNDVRFTRQPANTKA